MYENTDMEMAIFTQLYFSVKSVLKQTGSKFTSNFLYLANQVLHFHKLWPSTYSQFQLF